MASSLPALCQRRFGRVYLAVAGLKERLTKFALATLWMNICLQTYGGHLSTTATQHVQANSLWYAADKTLFRSAGHDPVVLLTKHALCIWSDVKDGCLWNSKIKNILHFWNAERRLWDSEALDSTNRQAKPIQDSCWLHSLILERYLMWCVFRFTTRLSDGLDFAALGGHKIFTFFPQATEDSRPGRSYGCTEKK